ncbi:MAG: hydroxymethylbilane synthase [Selenomonadaceae bacterium]|nr:hydroxymethylbilane synthase [Selenomonadaceae bacterium]
MVIGTRKSKLALWQANFVKIKLEEKYPRLKIRLKEIVTKGDKILDAPLSKIGGKGLFTKELEESMLSGEIDIAVHSLKDMPTKLPTGLSIIAVTKRLDSGDAFVSDKYKSMDELPPGAKIGTSSLRRKAQLLRARSDLEIVSLRGNVETRLRKITEENLDGAVLAVAGLKRLGFEDKISEVISKDIMLPAVGQGALAVEGRRSDKEVIDLLSFLNDDATKMATKAERAFLARVDGGCQAPVGVYGEVSGKNLHLTGAIVSLDGKRLYRKEAVAPFTNAEHLGINLAEELLSMGGSVILKDLGIL